MPLTFNTTITSAHFDTAINQLSVSGHAFAENYYVGHSNIQVSITGMGVWVSADSIDSWSDTQSKGTFTSGLSGNLYDVRLISSDDEVATLSDAFLLVDAGTASSVYGMLAPSIIEGTGITISATASDSLYSILDPTVVIHTGTSIIVYPDSVSSVYALLSPDIIKSVRPDSSILELYVSPYYTVYSGGIVNWDETDDMPDEWLRKCDGQDYENEREVYRDLTTEAYNRFGVCMTYYIVSYDTQYDRIWGEDNNRRFTRKFEFMAFYPLQSEEKMWTRFAIEGIDKFSVFISKDHFRIASTYGQSTVRGNIGPNTYPIYVPKTGDIVQSMFNKYLYEVVTVKEEAMMMHLNKRYVWELVVKPYMDEHLSLDTDTSASMGTVSAFVDVKPDILDVSQNAISAAALGAYTPKSCERPARDPWGGW